jgi:hypothetical protein
VRRRCGLIKDEGRQIFVDELTRLATEMADKRVTAIAERAAAPLRVAVCGRRGVGRGTVSEALAAAGVTVTAQPGAEVVVYVVAEVVKPEDTAAVAALPQPVLPVFNKVDLTGPDRGGQVAALTGTAAEPLVGLLAVAACDDRLDDTLWSALQLLAADPAELGCADDFVTRPHRLPREVRLRLCDTLGVFGIVHAVAAIRRGSPAAAVRAELRRLSGVDAVAARIASVGAEVAYTRISDAVAELEALAVGAKDRGRVGEFLSGDDVVAARMAAATNVIEAAGLAVDSSDVPAAHLRRAAAWHRYSRGTVTGLHRACGRDIARGSLRLWAGDTR